MSVKNAVTPLDPLTRTMRGGGAIPRPSTRRRGGILFGFCLRRVSDGVNFAFRIKGWEKVIYLRKYPPLPFVKAPEEKDPTVLAEKPNTHALTPEEIMSGDFEQPKWLTPEEIGDAKL